MLQPGWPGEGNYVDTMCAHLVEIPGGVRCEQDARPTMAGPFQGFQERPDVAVMIPGGHAKYEGVAGHGILVEARSAGYLRLGLRRRGRLLLLAWDSSLDASFWLGVTCFSGAWLGFSCLGLLSWRVFSCLGLLS